MQQQQPLHSSSSSVDLEHMQPQLQYVLVLVSRCLTAAFHPSRAMLLLLSDLA